MKTEGQTDSPTRETQIDTEIWERQAARKTGRRDETDTEDKKHRKGDMRQSMRRRQRGGQSRKTNKEKAILKDRLTDETTAERYFDKQVSNWDKPGAWIHRQTLRNKTN